MSTYVLVQEKYSNYGKALDQFGLLSGTLVKTVIQELNHIRVKEN